MEIGHWAGHDVRMASASHILKYSAMALCCLGMGCASRASHLLPTCDGAAALGRSELLIADQDEVIAAAKIYVAATYGPEKARYFEPRLATKIREGVWEINGFTPGGIGRLTMQIDAGRSCVIASVIQG